MYNFPVNEFTSADEKLTVIVFCSLKAISVVVGVTEKGDDSPFFYGKGSIQRVYSFVGKYKFL